MRWEKVFISYSNQDLELVQKIADYLSRIGIEPYLADRRPEIDRYLADKIVANILDSNCFVAILTPTSVKSQWVNQEIGFTYALQRHGRVIPIYRMVELSLHEPKAIRGFLEAKEHIPMDLNQLDYAIYKLRVLLRQFINRNKDVLEQIKVTCKSCKLEYRVPLPSLQELNDRIEKGQAVPTECQNKGCRIVNKLDPKTLDVIQ